MTFFQYHVNENQLQVWRVFEMPRKSHAFKYHGGIAVVIPEKSANKIGLEAGDAVKVSLNSLSSVRVEKVTT